MDEKDWNPKEEECKRLLIQWGMEENIKRHTLKVVEVAKRLCDNLVGQSNTLNRDLVIAGAYLHDIKRKEPNHAKVGGEFLVCLGYKEVGEVVASHMQLDPYDEENITEKTIVYLADKLVEEDKEVNLEERFARSKRKCKSQEALVQHEKRRQQAMSVYKHVEEKMSVLI